MAARLRGGLGLCTVLSTAAVVTACAGVAGTQTGDPASGREVGVSAGSVQVLDLERQRYTSGPTTPRRVTARAKSGHQINVAWSPATSQTKVVGYDLRRGGRLIK